MGVVKLPGAVVDLVGREQGDAGVLVVGVVPGHVPSHKDAGLLDVGEGAGEGAGVVRSIFHRAELRPRERIIVGDPRPVVGLSDLQIGEQILQDG
nr:hypothetical protein [Rhodoglobus vestalii]